MPLITGTQIRMARAATGMSVRDLASIAGVSPNTVSRCETGHDAQAKTMDALERALIDAGVEFIPENGGGVGVRLRRPAG